MKWLDISAPRVAELAQTLDVCIVPVGCIESHGPHMPSGADGLSAEVIAVQAAEREEAIVFPTIYFNACAPGKPLPGVTFEHNAPAISYPPSLLMALLRQTFLEIARAGFRKIICLGGHAPTQLAVSALQFELQEEAQDLHRNGHVVPLVFYVSSFALTEPESKALGLATSHGGAAETAYTAACAPDLVDLDLAATLPPSPKAPPRIKGLGYVHNWCRNAPGGYVGDPAGATLEAGRRIVESAVTELARMIRDLKAYDETRDQ